MQNENTDGLGLVVVDSALLPQEPAGRRVTVLAFRNRFTQAEKVRIEMAALDNPTAPMEVRTLAAAVRAGMADLAAATYVNLDREDTRAQVLAFEAMGLLDIEGRALRILDASIDPQEAYAK